MRISLGFARTTCGCEQCQLACIHLPGILIPEDIHRIAAHLGYTDLFQFARENLLASKGWKLASSADSLVFKRVPSLVMKKVEGGCVRFKDGRCTIHEVSPFGCAMFDSHQEDRNVWQPRSAAAARIVEADFESHGIYSQIHAMLVSEGRVSRDPRLNVADLKAATEELERRNSLRKKNKERDKKKADRKKKSR